MTALVDIIAIVCFVWSFFVLVVEFLGITAIFKHFSQVPAPPVSPDLGPDAPKVTIIRPVKGLEPRLYECLASTFRQKYPTDRLSIRLCVADRCDPSYPVLQKIVEDFPEFDAEIFVENDSTTEQVGHLGPNPKIRNISRAYNEAKGDVIWIIDCNVWVATGVLGRMVDKLMGYSRGGRHTAPFKFVHQLPLVVDIVEYGDEQSLDDKALLSSASEAGPQTDLKLPSNPSALTQARFQGGGRLDEMFMATTHAKFYGAINIVGIAPCIVGKSNMFRKSHLDRVTDPSRNPVIPKNNARPKGVDYFSHHICEDHSIGDILWRSKIPGHANHGIVWGDLVVQPMAGMSIRAYIARRVRWLRARKFTVLAATLVEPGVESLLCGVYMSFGLTTVPWFNEKLGIPRTWGAMAYIWAVFVTAWMLVDWVVFRRLHSARSIEMDASTPSFAKGTTGSTRVLRRSFMAWLPAWIGREILALPIWTWAVLLGETVTWRGKTFKVRFDTTVEEIVSPRASGEADAVHGKGGGVKDRVD